ncbi:hypothetical protein [Arsenicicoccus dermatophilus]|uniref:hypothetical protein n=1 Tax=Arsenicicoccus dermatophilus TaxID=1076331 RepID=UPI001F4CBA07|nr:hypothetical protein [Arsenicicoccus dermatophilus]MCH8614354.1 hypothetical protein [Arsenicicoccus dermatophilus]
MTLPSGTHAFTGQIAGLGFAEGTRVVVGRWTESPFGAFTDVMVERGDGHRVLLAPTAEVAETVGQLYTFDEVQVVPVDAAMSGSSLVVTAGPLRLRATIGKRPALGKALAAAPSGLQRTSWFSKVTDPIARAVQQGVRTRGTTANGLQATYGATDLHLVTAAQASWSGTDLGELGRIDPPVRFGFGSTPPEPTLTSLTTTIEVPRPDPLTGVIDCWGMGALREKQAREAGHAAAVADEREREHADAAEERMRELTDAAADETGETGRHVRSQRAAGADAGEIRTVLSEQRAGQADEDHDA